MPSSLTATKIKDTYGQILHVDGGVTSTPKLVYDGDGTATALKVSTTAIEVPALTLSGGVANGVAYLNGSKVLTTGSALTFDGTNLGLGTASPTSYGAGYSVTDIKGSTGGALVMGHGSTNDLQIYGSAAEVSIGSLAAIPMLFKYNGSEQMRLTSTGLGIGTSFPSEKLSVNGNIGLPKSGVTRIYNTQSTSDSVKLGGALNIEFETYSGSSWNTKMLLDNPGNLGLGVTPSAWGGNLTGALEFKGKGSITGSGASIISFYTLNGYQNGSNWIYSSSDYASQYRQVAGQHQWYNSPVGTAGNAISFTTAMTLDASGNLLLGTTTNSAVWGKQLRIADTNYPALCLSSTNATYGRSYTIGLDGTSVAASSIVFRDDTAAAERMRIDSSGNVGIGSSAPTSKLQVVGLPVYANNAAAIAGGLTAGAFYRTGADPDPVCVVH